MSNDESQARKIVHFTTVHPRGDTRIRVKETASLAEGMGAGVALYVQDGKGPERDEVSGVEVVDTGPPRNVSTFFQQIGGFFYVTTSGSARLTGVGTVLKLSGSAKTCSAGRPSSGLMHTRSGGRLTTGGPLT